MELFAADGHDAGGCERVTGKSGMRPFVGCYGGRIPGNRAKREGASRGAEEDAALGLCWTKDAIEEICRAGWRGGEPTSDSRGLVGL